MVLGFGVVNMLLDKEVRFLFLRSLRNRECFISDFSII